MAVESVDEEYDFWAGQLTELDQLSQRLHESAAKYKDALAAMLKHQESFAKTLLEVYQPIVGRYAGVESPQGSNGELHSPIGGMALARKERPRTSDESIKQVQEFVAVSTHISEALISQLVSYTSNTCDDC